MSHSDRLKRTPDTFRQLTGLSPPPSTACWASSTPRYHQAETRRKDRPGRRRKPGAGRKHTLPLADRLLMLLIYYRTYVSHAFLGFLFGLDDSAVCRNINPLQPLLAGIFRIPERRVELRPRRDPRAFFRRHRAADAPAQAAAAAVLLGQEEAAHAEEPGRRGPQAQGGRPAQGGHKQKRRLRIAAVSPTSPGKVHDKKVYDRTRVLVPPGVERTGTPATRGRRWRRR